jgi:hypothetical protein
VEDDYHLQPDSPALDVGTQLLDVTDDLDGVNALPAVGGAWIKVIYKTSEVFQGTVGSTSTGLLRVLKLAETLG